MPFCWAVNVFFLMAAGEDAAGVLVWVLLHRGRDEHSGASSLDTRLPSGRRAFEAQSESFVMYSSSPSSLCSRD